MNENTITYERSIANLEVAMDGIFAIEFKAAWENLMQKRAAGSPDVDKAIEWAEDVIAELGVQYKRLDKLVYGNGRVDDDDDRSYNRSLMYTIHEYVSDMWLALKSRTVELAVLTIKYDVTYARLVDELGYGDVDYWYYKIYCAVDDTLLPDRPLLIGVNID